MRDLIIILMDSISFILKNFHCLQLEIDQTALSADGIVFGEGSPQGSAFEIIYLRLAIVNVTVSCAQQRRERTIDFD